LFDSSSCDNLTPGGFWWDHWLRVLNVLPPSYHNPPAL
jgi:hypothetical protein